ncbi:MULTISPECIES: hypothetical protein [Ruminococcus]|uniref:Lipoprotein n=1 Tax=Ruminococcus flavefaciens TaxID=1265 RepID=A0A1M7MH56_RUMFL|nr:MULTISPECIES: hypothetical protein [Ruminococcus]MCR4795695.1 hypothetical protein [Ruminococcus sp.]SHM89722.1 hypothetical protein SAMN04487860_12224 [Ruminococcus flavefaciens]
MKQPITFIFFVALIGTIACGISFGIALTKKDNMISQIALGTACMFCLTTAATTAKKLKKK